MYPGTEICLRNGSKRPLAAVTECWATRYSGISREQNSWSGYPLMQIYFLMTSASFTFSLYVLTETSFRRGKTPNRLKHHGGKIPFSAVTTMWCKLVTNYQVESQILRLTK